MKEYILITGASSGIGYEMAKILAQKKYNLILVARSIQKLEQLQKYLVERDQVEVQFIPKDLSNPQNAMELYDEIKFKNLIVTHLVNNAGFGGYGDFVETSLDHELDMVNLNISSLMVLNKLFGRDMSKRKSGRIMNVASILSFLPFPYYSVYSATKSFVLAFSQTVAAELEDSGVIVTTLCPGTVETPFHTPEMRKTNAMSANKPFPPEEVAKEGVQLLLHGKGKKVVGKMNWFLTNLPRITPGVIMMRIKKNLASIPS
ncbi:SDR family NAD(P)-dependent oxidoreductase [Aquiflexum lacus]|uniref:SDR family NAD(P)-dependent oxidoreductase n=1 Tax=Aquiflexum lacus TaxID=2483805 RepID=UPI001893EF4D|nr:SDR family oxidoreductase [Aquiflexum lacus]